MDLTISHPEGFPLDARVQQSLHHTAARSGGSIRSVTSLDEAVEGAVPVWITADVDDARAQRKQKHQ